MKRISRIIAVVALAVAASASAQMMGNNGGGMNGGDHAAVAADGTVLLLRPSVAQGTPTPRTMELVAVTPAGGVAWRHALAAGMHDFAIAGNTVIVLEDGQGVHRQVTTHTGQESNVTGLQLADGALAWSVRLGGAAMSLTADTDRVYVVSVTANGGSTGGSRNGGVGGRGMGGGGHMGGGQGSGTISGTRSMTAINLAGEVLWTLPLES